METCAGKSVVAKPLRRRVELSFGRATLDSKTSAELREGDVVELDAFVDDYIDVCADGRLIGRGRAVVVEGKLAVRIQEALAGQE